MWVVGGFDMWVSGYCVLLRIDSQPRTKGNGGFCDGFCCVGILEGVIALAAASAAAAQIS